jgi:hypothetical protein
VRARERKPVGAKIQYNSHRFNNANIQARHCTVPQTTAFSKPPQAFLLLENTAYNSPTSDGLNMSKMLHFPESAFYNFGACYGPENTLFHKNPSQYYPSTCF